MKDNFKILVVDDEVLIAEFLKHTLRGFGYVHIQLAHNKAEALTKLTEFKPDLVLLDIRMETDLEGIEIAEHINSHYKTPFIFITSHSDEGIIQQSLKTEPWGYITKPYKKADLLAAVQIIEKQKLKNEYSSFVFKDGHDTVKLMTEDILYVKSDGHYIDIFTAKKKYTLRNTLDWFMSQTPKELFHRTHRSVVVNVSHVTKSTSKSVFIGEVEIPVSRGNQLRMN